VCNVQLVSARLQKLREIQLCEFAHLLHSLPFQPNRSALGKISDAVFMAQTAKVTLQSRYNNFQTRQANIVHGQPHSMISISRHNRELSIHPF
jgi:hypothetical protein